MSTLFTQAFGEFRSIKANIEQAREERNHLLSGLVEKTIADLQRVGLTIIFRDSKPQTWGLHEKAPVRQSDHGEDAYYGRIIPADLEGEEAARWHNLDSIPEWAPYVTFTVSSMGGPNRSYSIIGIVEGGFIRSRLGSDRHFMLGNAPNLSSPRLNVAGLARAMAALHAGLAQDEVDLAGFMFAKA